MKLISIFIFSLLFVFVSCTENKTVKNNNHEVTKGIVKAWNKYLDNTEKVISVTEDEKILLKLKNNLISLYIEGREEYDDFPDEISIRISKISEKIDKKINKNVQKNNIKYYKRFSSKRYWSSS